MSAAVKVGTLDVDRQAVDLYFDGSKNFYAEVLGERLNAPSMDRLKEKVRERLRAGDLKLAISATIVEFDADQGASGVDFTDVQLTGIHGGSGKVVYRETRGGRVDTWGGYRGVIAPKLSAAQRAEVKRLRQAVHDAEQAWSAWEENAALENDGRTLIQQEKARLIAAKTVVPA